MPENEDLYDIDDESTPVAAGSGFKLLPILAIVAIVAFGAVGGYLYLTSHGDKIEEPPSAKAGQQADEPGVGGASHTTSDGVTSGSAAPAEPEAPTVNGNAPGVGGANSADAVTSESLVLAKPQALTVTFGFDRADIGSSEREELRKFSEELKGLEGSIALDGYADSVGQEDYNLMLSNRRAQAVADELDGMGIGATSGIVAIGHGELADDGTFAEQAANRRVDIHFRPGG